MVGPTTITVPDGWQVVSLGEIACIRKGTVKAVEGDLPYIALEHIRSNGTLNGCGKASDSVSPKTAFCKGDTLYGKLRPNLRKVVRVDNDGVCSTDILAIYNNDLVDSIFLSHLLRGDLLHEHAMKGIAGTRMPRTSWNHLQTFKLLLPPLWQQQDIARCLDSIDKTIGRTEATIFAVEKLWDSLLHELLTRGVPGWHTEWRDVPGIGIIPVGWQVTNLGDVAKVVMGQSPSGETILDWDGKVTEREGLPFIQGNAEFCHRVPLPTKWCIEPLKIAESEDILLSIRAPVGDMNIANQRICIGRGLVALRFITMTSAFGWYAIQVARYRIERLTQGSTFQAIGKNEVLRLPVAKPKLIEQQAIVAVLSSIDKVLVELRHELQSLESLKISISFALLLSHMRIE